MAKKKRYPLGKFMKEFSSEGKRREYLSNLRWLEGFDCPNAASVMRACCPTAGINAPSATTRPQ